MIEALETLKYGLVLLNVLLLVFVWLATHCATHLHAKDAHVLLVIAHPDDESMFFVPTLCALAASSSQTASILCLSSGNFRQQGGVRRAELLKACETLNIAAERCTVLEHKQLNDGPHERWPADVICNVVAAHAQTHNVDAILTFDAHGVSGHANHCAISDALQQQPPQCAVYELRSVSLLVKYTGVFYALWAALCAAVGVIDAQTDAVFLSLNPLRSLRAMQAHASQFVWYRRLFVVFSCFTFINVVRKTKSQKQNKK